MGIALGIRCIHAQRCVLRTGRIEQVQLGHLHGVAALHAIDGKQVIAEARLLAHHRKLAFGDERGVVGRLGRHHAAPQRPGRHPTRSIHRGHSLVAAVPLQGYRTHAARLDLHLQLHAAAHRHAGLGTRHLQVGDGMEQHVIACGLVCGRQRTVTRLLVYQHPRVIACLFGACVAAPQSPAKRIARCIGSGIVGCADAIAEGFHLAARVEEEGGASREGRAILGVHTAVGQVSPVLVADGTGCAGIDAERRHGLQVGIEEVKLRHLDERACLYGGHLILVIPIACGGGRDVGIAPAVLIDPPV